MTNLARFKIGTSPSTDLGYEATTDGPLALQLEASSGLIRSTTFQVYDLLEPRSPLASLTAPALSLSNGTTSGTQVNASSPTAVVNASCPGGFLGSGRSSWIVRCLVNGGLNAQGKPDPDLVFERMIIHRVGGRRAIVPGERTQASPRGPWDEIVPGSDGIGYAGMASSTSLNASTASGSKTLTVSTAATLSAFKAGDRVRLSSRATPTDWCAGLITSYSGTTMVVAVDANAGANTTHTDWDIGITGPTGVGYAGLQSATSINASTVTPTASITTNLQATQTAFAVGDRVKLSSRSTPTDWCAGVIASFSGTAMAVTVDTNAGANVSHTDWSIAIAGDMPVPAPGAAGGTLQSNGTSWVRQLFLRTLGAIGLSGATGFLRGTDNEVLVSTNTGGADRAVLSTQTNGAGGGPILGDANLYSARMRASNNLYFEFGAGTVLLNTSGLSLGNYPITGLGAPSGAQDAVTKGFAEGLVGGAVYAIGNTGSSCTVNFGANGRNQSCTITANCSVTVNPPGSPGWVCLAITCGATPYTPTFTGSGCTMKIAGGPVPASKTTWVLFYYDGTNMVQVTAPAY